MKGVDYDDDFIVVISILYKIFWNWFLEIYNYLIFIVIVW